jgi:Flp pilus assembly protein TadG
MPTTSRHLPHTRHAVQPGGGRAPAGQAGGVVAELVVATPLLLLLVLLVVQFALWQHGAHVATAAAQEGARVARLEGGSAAAGRAEASDFLASLAPSLVRDPQVTARRDQFSARVEVAGTAEPVVPWLRLPIRAAVEAPVERFRPPDEPAPEAPIRGSGP